MGRRTGITRLEEHPNLSEVLGVLAQLAHVTDRDLPRLAGAWANDAFLAAARARALTPDSPLVCDVLAAFEAVSALFEDDLRGEQPYVTVDPAVAAIASAPSVTPASRGSRRTPSTTTTSDSTLETRRSNAEKRNSALLACPLFALVSRAMNWR